MRAYDVPALLSAVLASTAHLAPWMAWAEGYDRVKAAAFVAMHAQENDRDSKPVGELPYAMCDRTDRLLGLCGLHAMTKPGVLEIGYWVDARHTRRGVATLGSAIITEMALRLPGVESTEIHHDRANVASGAIPARLGYTHVATVEDEPEAPAEEGVEYQWRLRRDEFPGSEAARLLAGARAAEPDGRPG